jgi:DNA polymerase III subunit gamma/tau
MSYLVLARKWRPRNFSEVIGQTHVVRILESAILHNRVAHAYVFSGPRGVGKTSIARILAKSLNCAKGPTSTPCESCSSCTEIQSGSNFDVIEIDGASNNSVNDIRGLRGNVQYGPSEHRWKVYIIDEVHMLSNSAFNALLKTLEEPPPNTVFIFATTELHKLPLTVLSRCQRFDFQRLSPAEIESSLKRVSEAEGVQLEARTISLIARRADGGMRDAQSLLDQILSFSEQEVKHEEVVHALGLVEQDLVYALFELIQNKDAAAAFCLSRDLASSGADLPEYLLQVAEAMRNLLLLNLAPDGSLLDLPADQIEPLRAFESIFSEADLLRMMHFLASSLENLKRGGQQRLRFELTLLRLVRFEQSVEVDALLKGLAGLPKDALADLEEKKTPKSNRFASVLKGASKLGSQTSGSLSKTPPDHLEPLAKATPSQAAPSQAAPSQAAPSQAAPSAVAVSRTAASQAVAPPAKPATKRATPKITPTPAAPLVPNSKQKSMDEIRLAWPNLLHAMAQPFPLLIEALHSFLPVALDSAGLHLKGHYDSSLSKTMIERSFAKLTPWICEFLELDVSTPVHFVEGVLNEDEKFMRSSTTHLDGASRIDELKREEPVLRDLFDRMDGRLLR